MTTDPSSWESSRSFTGSVWLQDLPVCAPPPPQLTSLSLPSDPPLPLPYDFLSSQFSLRVKVLLLSFGTPSPSPWPAQLLLTLQDSVQGSPVPGKAPHRPPVRFEYTPGTPTATCAPLCQFSYPKLPALGSCLPQRY